MSWNVAGRVGRTAQQVSAVERQEADLLCLQEVRATTVTEWELMLQRSGLAHLADSSGRSSRKLFNLTASRWPLFEIGPLDLPQPERLLSVRIEAEFGEFDLHNVHVPPTQASSGLKVKTLEILYAALARPSSRSRVLCGDFNTTGPELAPGNEATPGTSLAAESLLLKGLSRWDLVDVFRYLHGDLNGEPSRSSPGFHRIAGNRLDHILASLDLGAVYCDYQHGWRQLGLSDHSAMEAIFEPGCGR